jgi:dienelactone hydrolase
MEQPAIFHRARGRRICCATVFFATDLCRPDPYRRVWLFGGHSALLTVQRCDVEKRFARKFRAVAQRIVSRLLRSHLCPPLILIGAADDWTTVQSCREMVARPYGDGAQIDLVVYPSAYHGFNFPQLQGGIRFLGHWLEYNGPTATDAWAKVRTFLALRLHNPL